MKQAIFLFCLLVFTGKASAEKSSPSKKPARSCGEIVLYLHDGGRSETWRYRFNAEQMRIDQPGNIIPAPPINLFDFESGTLSILHPHNGSWEKGAIKILNKKLVPRNAMPDFPKPPAMSNLGSQMNPPAGMPPMPTIHPRESKLESLELVAQNQTNRLFGFRCVLYKTTLPHHNGDLLIWATDNPNLPPFYLPRQRIHQHQFRPGWREEVSQLLREKKLFPFYLSLQVENKKKLVEWKVIRVKTNIKDEPQKEIFTVPKKLHLLPSM